MPRKKPFTEWTPEQKAKQTAYNNEEDENGHPRWRKAHFKHKYNLTIEEYEKHAEAQGFKCAICQSPPETMLYVDHSHETMEIRGLLCRECNAGLGFFKENPDTLRKAALYVQNFG